MKKELSRCKFKNTQDYCYLVHFYKKLKCVPVTRGYVSLAVLGVIEKKTTAIN